MGISWGQGAGGRGGGSGTGAGVARGTGRYDDEMLGNGARAAQVCGVVRGVGDSIFCGESGGGSEPAVFRADRLGTAERIGRLRFLGGKSGVGGEFGNRQNQGG